MDSLLPDGIASLLDLPFTVFMAVRHAMVILSWEELPKDEKPPKRIWLDGDKLKEHFDWVERKREAESKGRDEHIDDPRDNEAAGALIVG